MATKTPVTVLQELMNKHRTVPHFEMSEADSNGIFYCKVKALEVSALATGRSKKEAKHESARVALEKLAEQGKYFPRNCDNVQPSSSKTNTDSQILLNNVGILRDICNEFRVNEPVFECISETGPPHFKQFVVQCTTGSVVRTSTSTTKKQAKQMAAGLVFEYFQTHMPKRLAELSEIEDSTAIAKANAFAAEKYLERTTEQPWRPNLGMKVADYIYGWREIDKAKSSKALELLKTDIKVNSVELLENILGVLELEFEWSTLPCVNPEEVIAVIDIPKSNPPTTLASPPNTYEVGKYHTAVETLQYINLMLNM